MVLSARFLSIHAKYLTISGILVIFSLAGDHFIYLLQVSSSTPRLFRNGYFIAAIDNVIHSVIGAFSWILVSISRGAKIDDLIILQAISTAFFASVIDVDHLIAARSFDLKVILQLQQRPFLHCTTFVLSLAMLVILTGIWSKNLVLHTCGWIFLVASFTHHLRDALRRGFWLSPFVYKTKPVPLLLYVIALVLFPLICSVIMENFAHVIFKRTDKYKLLPTDNV